MAGFSFAPKVMEPFSGCFASANEILQLMKYAPAMSIKNTEMDVDLRTKFIHGLVLSKNVDDHGFSPC